VQSLKLRLEIEQVHGAGTSGHEQLDDPLDLRGMVHRCNAMLRQSRALKHSGQR
jgi:hypothetical protein